MKPEKITYEPAKIDVVLLSRSDIVTASTADSFDYVDQNGWDS